MANPTTRDAKPGHAAGIFADMSLDGPIIGTLVIVVDRAKNLPNRRAIGKQDPYCAMRLGKEAKKTPADKRGGQTPKWDKELRFNVHDSPDYYKLKCSIFNDDKKTELIGEAWVDLSSVIKRGGGQADMWQPLTFKGRYAGEIRLEFTYYDTREQPVVPVAEPVRRKVRETIQAFSGPQDMASEFSVGSLRHIGPREIRRRPLPQLSINSNASQASNDFVAPQVITNQHYLVDEPLQEAVIHAPIPVRPSPSPEPDLQRYHEQDYNDQAYAYEEHHEDPSQHNTYTGHDLQYDQRYDHGYADGQSIPSTYHTTDFDDVYGQVSPEQTPSTYQYQDIYGQGRPHSSHASSEPTTPFTSSPLALRPSPHASNSEVQLQQFRHDARPKSMSPQKSQVFRDSPLRQSISNLDVTDVPSNSSGLPPLPPTHKQALRRSGLDGYNNPYAAQQCGQRSPLQSLEDQYSAYTSERSLPTRPISSSHALHYEHFLPDHQTMYRANERAFLEHDGHGPALPANQYMPYMNDEEYTHSAGRRSNGYGMQPTQQQHQTRHSQPHQPSVEDESSITESSTTVSRKAIGDQPKRLSQLPFSPDDFEVLNPEPGLSSMSGTRTPEQLKEEQRLREVSKLRDLGPIIGNDGRVIDPSDHLPSDTWAPEPERKNKKPEHVIHIKSRSGPAGARSANVVLKHNGSADFAKVAGTSSPPGTATSRLPARGAAMRQEGVRPLPQQPYPSPKAQPHLQSSPAATPPSAFQSNRPSSARRVSWSNDLTQEIPSSQTRSRPQSGIYRSAPDEYQIPTSSSYLPRGESFTKDSPSPQAYEAYQARTNPMKILTGRPLASSHNTDPQMQQPARHHSYDTTPTKKYTQNTHEYNQQNSLAAEMSTIDLGPSRPTSSYRNNGDQSTAHMVYGNGFEHERGMSLPAVNMSRSMVRVGHRY